MYDLETGKRTHTLEGHDDYVHKVVVDAGGGSLVASGGEDGQVLVWDPRVGREPRHRLFPHTHEELARPSIGKFVATLDLTGDDWLVSNKAKRMRWLRVVYNYSNAQLPHIHLYRFSSLF